MCEAEGMWHRPSRACDESGVSAPFLSRGLRGRNLQPIPLLRSPTGTSVDVYLTHASPNNHNLLFPRSGFREDQEVTWRSSVLRCVAICSIPVEYLVLKYLNWKEPSLVRAHSRPSGLRHSGTWGSSIKSFPVASFAACAHRIANIAALQFFYTSQDLSANLSSTHCLKFTGSSPLRLPSKHLS